MKIVELTSAQCYLGTLQQSPRYTLLEAQERADPVFWTQKTSGNESHKVSVGPADALAAPYYRCSDSESCGASFSVSGDTPVRTLPSRIPSLSLNRARLGVSYSCVPTSVRCSHYSRHSDRLCTSLSSQMLHSTKPVVGISPHVRCWLQNALTPNRVGWAVGCRLAIVGSP